MKKVFGLLFNKFSVTAIAFLVWMTFFDQNDWMTQQETKKQLQDTKDHINFLTAQTEEMEADLKLLQSDPQRLEPVSYTHLDVYKRQGLYYSAIWFMLWYGKEPL